MTSLVAVLHHAPRRGRRSPTAAAVDEHVLLRQQDRLRRLVQRLLAWSGEAGEIEDVVQETLLRAWTHRRRFRGDCALETWLSRIALNAARSHVRRRRRWARRARPLDGEIEDGSGGGAGDGRPAEAHAAVHRGLAALSHRDREVLVLRYLERRPIVDIAGLLGVGRAAVDARLSRARARLREVLQGGVGGD